MRKCAVRTVAIVPAAGSGRRLKGRERKPFVALRGKPLIAHALKSLDSSEYIDTIIVAVEAPFIKRLKGIITKYGIGKVSAVVRGGRTRSESVRNCFDSIEGQCDIVLIHDGARPFISKELIRDSVAAARRFGACVTAVPETDTVKLSGRNLFVKKTLDRRCLWRAQTPQVFRYSLLKRALSRIKNDKDITDDSSYLERLGKRVKILKGSAKNIKVTTKEDLKIAEVLLNTDRHG